MDLIHSYYQSRLVSTTNLEVVVLDVNDNPPEFSSKAYFASVEEGAAGGAEGGSSEDVVRVLATSRDSGVNAEISYSIVGGNEHRLFSIDPERGVVAVKGGGVDYERQVSNIPTRRNNLLRSLFSLATLMK